MLKEKQLIRFLLLSIGIYAIWFLLFEFIIKPNGKLDHMITLNITQAICTLLNLSGYDTIYTIARKLGETYIYLNHQSIPVIRVGASCNGLELLALFTIFIVCYPGNWRYKIPFILIGNLSIHLLNIFRNYILTLMAIHKSQYFELFHRYVFVFVVYGFIFLLWMLWADKYSHLKLKGE